MARRVPLASARTRAYAHTKRRVLEQPTGSATFLSEEEIASELGVSRTPVREAMLRLEAERLIELVPHRGAFIPPIASGEITDVMDAREAIEAFSLSKVERPAELGARLADLLAKQRSQIDDAEKFVEGSRAFHAAIVDSTGNRVLSDFYGSLRDRMMRMGLVAVSRDRSRTRQFLAEHEAIVVALSNRGRGPGTRALLEHLSHMRGAFLGQR